MGHAAPIQSLAVLPLDNLSGNPEEEYLADDMTEELITELGRNPQPGAFVLETGTLSSRAGALRATSLKMHRRRIVSEFAVTWGESAFGFCGALVVAVLTVGRPVAWDVAGAVARFRRLRCDPSRMLTPSGRIDEPLLFSVNYGLKSSP